VDTERPIRLVVTDDLERTRVTVFFRLLLAIPHIVWLLLWSIAAFTAAFVVWVAVLFERKAPRTLHGFIASYIRYATQLSAYLSFAADPYPGFTGQPGYPVDVEIDPPAVQGRWGAGLRLLLAFPALLLAAVLGGGLESIVSSVPVPDQSSSSYTWGAGIGGVVGVVAVLGWFACLVKSRMPRGMRDLGVYAIYYAAQTYGYLLLLTDRYPSADPALVHPAELPGHPVRIEVTDSLQRSRLTVFFRLLLALPHIVWVLLWTALAVVVGFLAWLAAIVTGRVPHPLRRFLTAYVRYLAHLDAFLYLVGGPFPGFTGAPGSYPVDVEIEPADRQGRWGVLFRGVLAIPAFVIAGALGGVLLVVAVFGWFTGVFVARMPADLRALGASSLRYVVQTYAYAFLVTDRYPYSAPFLQSDPHDEQLELELPAPAGPGVAGEIA
jgi:hypothetical protein